MDADRRLLIACLDLTALGDDEDERSIEALCERAIRPFGDDELTVAAVCIWPRSVSLARDRLSAPGVRVAVATGGFPLPDAPLPQRIEEIRRAVDAGADEVDVPVNRFLLDEPDALVGELRSTREAAGSATWKAIVETGGSGKSVACAICHGDTMKGLGNVPRLAGLHPIYIARQLYLFKDGSRNGVDAQLMKKAVAQLTDEDILALAAYLSSLVP